MTIFSETSGALFFGEDSFEELEKIVLSYRTESVFILADGNTKYHCLPELMKLIPILNKIKIVEVPSGESGKSIEGCLKIISELFDLRADRRSLLINLGGGMICDLGGFSASVYKRGIDFINIPTSLLSMVDASVGGKNGVNFKDAKNIIGTFSEPRAVFINSQFLKTLPGREFRSGFAEIIKHSLLAGKGEWQRLLKIDYFNLAEGVLNEIIERSVRFKASVVNEDLMDQGRRKILNFGHTIGHALESEMLKSEQPISHGEAVAAGMIAELFISHKIAGLSEVHLTQAVQYIGKIFADVVLPKNPEKLFSIFMNDKKNENGMIAFSLLKEPGIPAGIVFPERKIILESINFMMNAFSRMNVYDKN